eukprot:gnl/Dysnectes_brevis/2539_a3055_1363.p1 GENE.gnl/Dysnectes_brevis/2539_a3055_1363~~gnl/Dysnectes_brevis/2539_a3055_1363.p1  ORF type:complete len:512 (-),score=103.69 gnl/Dysnectes_brevis/2539_a3055_1363:51-1586(-)
MCFSRNRHDREVSKNRSRSSSLVFSSFSKSDTPLKQINSPFLTIDIGGTLLKVAIFVPSRCRPTFRVKKGFRHCIMHSLSFTVPQLDGDFVFMRFETAMMPFFVRFVRRHHFPFPSEIPNSSVLRATGGGAFKYKSQIVKDTGYTDILQCDEIRSVVSGLNFLLAARNLREEIFTYHLRSPEPRRFRTLKKPYPYLLVQIGSGVSFIKVSGAYTFTRIDGSSLGGGAFLGLCRLFTGELSFDRILSLALQGSSERVDLLVKDIYGKSYDSAGLSSNTIAATLGKAKQGASRADVANSLLKAISLNVAQLAYHNARRHTLPRIVFAGSFIRDHPVTTATITLGLDYWSFGRMKPLFVKHEAVTGALGALLSRKAPRPPPPQASRKPKPPMMTRARLRLISYLPTKLFGEFKLRTSAMASEIEYRHFNDEFETLGDLVPSHLHTPPPQLIGVEEESAEEEDRMEMVAARLDAAASVLRIESAADVRSIAHSVIAEPIADVIDPSESDDISESD